MAKIKVSFRLSPESIDILKNKGDMTQFVDAAIQYTNANKVEQKHDESQNQIKIEEIS